LRYSKNIQVNLRKIQLTSEERDGKSSPNLINISEQKQNPKAVPLLCEKCPPAIILQPKSLVLLRQTTAGEQRSDKPVAEPKETNKSIYYIVCGYGNFNHT